MMISFVVVIFMLYTVTVSLTSQCNFVWDPSNALSVYAPGVCSYKSFLGNTSSEYKCILHGSPNQWHIEYNYYNGSGNCDATQASVTSTIFNESTWGSFPSSTYNGTFQYECGGIDCPARIDLYMNELYDGVNATNGSECEPGPLWSENIVVDDVCLCRTSNITACRSWGCTADGDYVMNAMGCNALNETDISTFTSTDGCAFVPYLYVDVNCGTAPDNYNATEAGNLNTTESGNYNTTESGNYNTTESGNYNATETGNYSTTETGNYNTTELGNSSASTTESGIRITTTEWGDATESSDNTTTTVSYNGTPQGNETESNGFGYGIAILLLIINGLF